MAGRVRIERLRTVAREFPLCEACFDAARSPDWETERLILQKFLGDVKGAGEVTAEQTEAPTATRH